MTKEEKITDEHEQLSRFVGRWNTEGKISATNATPEVKITGTDNYEWLPGEYFLLHKVDVLVGDDKNETFEVIGFDKLNGKYTMQHYDNKGNSGYMIATYEKGVWIFLGESLKFTGGFKKEDKEFSGIWEQLTNGKNWSHFMDIKLTKPD
ncbi:MAG: DUF1579 family protein [Ignavibacteria bacterium]|nr:DUF1579 family protein [Ignavibacteria bacterium]